MLQEGFPAKDYPMPTPELADAFAHARAMIAAGDDMAIRLAFARIVSTLNDGHSIMPPQPAMPLHLLPIKLQVLSDGIYVLEASRQWQHLEGARLVAIGEMPIAEVTLALRPYIGAENQGQVNDRLPLYLAQTELLHAIGASDSVSDARLHFELNEQVISASLSGASFWQWAWFYFAPYGQDPDLPYSTRLQHANYRSQWHADEKLLYVSISSIQQQRFGADFSSFIAELATQIDSLEVERLVLDLRQNRGGNDFLMRELVSMLRNKPKVNRPGHMFTLISGRTYSAAVNLVSMLENQTHSLFVGEPSGAGANHFGDPAGHRLPNSGLWYSLSTRQWRGNDPADQRSAIEPDLSITYRFDDYAKGRDPAMEAILALPVAEPAQAVDTSSLAVVAGDYLLNPHQRLGIHADSHGQYWLSVTDGDDDSLANLHLPLYPARGGEWLATSSRPWLALKRGVGGEVSVRLHGREYGLAPIPADYLLPRPGLFNAEMAQMPAALARLKALDSPPATELEPGLNRLGYRLLSQGQPKLALAVFEYMTHWYPASGNAWDSRGEAALSLGMVKEASAIYRRALYLDENNRYARDMLARLEEN